VNQISTQVGFSQRIRLEWFEQTANFVLAGNDRKAITSSLQTILKEKVSVGGVADRGNREKIISILMKVWVNASPKLEAFRNDGLELVNRWPKKNHIAVHWGMVAAVYPFWATVAGHTGRLLKLQSTTAASHQGSPRYPEPLPLPFKKNVTRESCSLITATGFLAVGVERRLNYVKGSKETLKK
jgi:hypothetical protein